MIAECGESEAGAFRPDYSAKKEPGPFGPGPDYANFRRV
jgi:hypothetical protein